MLKLLSRAITELRRRRKAKAERAEKAKLNQAFAAARRRVTERDDAELGYRAAVNKLTNWQRHQWARAGRPGSGTGAGDRDASAVLKFLVPRRQVRGFD